jgi:glycosyltransferase involved in cell wall biosynthesis
MRIGVLTHLKHPVRQPFPGGLEAFTYDATLGLRDLGHDVTLFASSSSAAELHAVPILDDSTYQHGNRPLASEYIDEHHAYLKTLLQIDRYGFDVIFNNSLHYVPVTMASLIHTPMLTVLHTPPFFELVEALSNTRRSGWFCTCSTANARAWRAQVPDCEVIANGIDLDFWYPRGTVGEHVLWFGRLIPDKGPQLAIAAALQAGVQLRLAGQITDQAFFDEQIAPHLGEQIRYLGHLDREALAAELASASAALVTPCWEEPFGLVVAEALACGTPVAAFARGALPELLDEDTGALAPAGDVPALAEALLIARGKSRVACRERAEAQWSHALMLKRYEKLLYEVMAAHAEQQRGNRSAAPSMPARAQLGGHNG